MANECIPLHEFHSPITCHANVAVTGKRFAVIAGNRADGTPRLGVPGAGVAVVAVVVRDAAIGEKVQAYFPASGLLPVRAGATITAGQLVETNATGEAIPRTTGVPCGRAVEDAAITADCLIDFRPHLI